MWSPLVLSLLAQIFARVSGDIVNEGCNVDLNDPKEIRGLWNLEEPFGVYASAIYNGSIAYKTIKKLPGLVITIIDSLEHDKDEIPQKYDAESLVELQQIVDRLKNLNNEIATNQPLTNLPLQHNEADRDAVVWNNYLDLRRELEGQNLSYFLTRFLVAECYIFRRISHAFALTRNFKNFDYFGKQKQRLLTNSVKILPLVAHRTLLQVNRSKEASKDETRVELTKFLKLGLWGNKFDLALSNGEDINQVDDPVELLSSMDKNLLINDTGVVWDILNKPHGPNDPAIVDIVLDNSGYELFTDLCLASFLVSRGLASKVRFHAKQIPWYASDVNVHDFHWVIDYMRNSSDPHLKEFGDLCALQLERGSWSIETDPFWTTFYDFGEMKKQAPALYERLSEATLVIVKGDLNYRKVVGDVNWERTTSLDTVLFHLNFKPTSVVTVRTVKALVCVGLTPEKLRLLKKDKEHMSDGTYGLINASAKNAQCGCPANR